MRKDMNQYLQQLFPQRILPGKGLSSSKYLSQGKQIPLSHQRKQTRYSSLSRTADDLLPLRALADRHVF